MTLPAPNGSSVHRASGRAGVITQWPSHRRAISQPMGPRPHLRGAGAHDPAPAFNFAGGDTLPRLSPALFIHPGRELGGETAHD